MCSTALLPVPLLVFSSYSGVCVHVGLVGFGLVGFLLTRVYSPNQGLKSTGTPVCITQYACEWMDRWIGAAINWMISSYRYKGIYSRRVQKQTKHPCVHRLPVSVPVLRRALSQP